MKKILLSVAVVLCSLSSFAQDCTKVLKTESYAGGSMTLINEPIRIIKENSGVAVNLLYGTNLILNIASTAKPYKCVNKNANMDIHFKDAQKALLLIWAT